MLVCLLVCISLMGGSVFAQDVGIDQTPAAASGQVVTLGADLTLEQRDAMLRVFGLSAAKVEERKIPLLAVTNAEEHALLSGKVPPEVIGSRAISSALVHQQVPGSGITVERYNITFVTDAMYGNALVTAGVRDARVVVAAPSPVSGTAALTGVFKAFERATGVELQPQAKETAGDELVTTGELSREIGSETKATELLARVKERVAAAESHDPQYVRRIVADVASELNIRLDKQQVDQVTDVAVKIALLGLEADELRTQVRNLREQVADTTPSKAAGSLWQRIIDYLARLISRFFSAFAGRFFQ